MEKVQVRVTSLQDIYRCPKKSYMDAFTETEQRSYLREKYYHRIGTWFHSYHNSKYGLCPEPVFDVEHNCPDSEDSKKLIYFQEKVMPGIVELISNEDFSLKPLFHEQSLYYEFPILNDNGEEVFNFKLTGHPDYYFWQNKCLVDLKTCDKKRKDGGLIKEHFNQLLAYCFLLNKAGIHVERAQVWGYTKTQNPIKMVHETEIMPYDLQMFEVKLYNIARTYKAYANEFGTLQPWQENRNSKCRFCSYCSEDIDG